jgi:hypothetical protein
MFLRNVGKRSTYSTIDVLTTAVRYGNSIVFMKLQEEQSCDAKGFVSIAGIIMEVGVGSRVA